MSGDISFTQNSPASPQTIRFSRFTFNMTVQLPDIDQQARFLRLAHIIQMVLVPSVFILGIARAATLSGRGSRSDIYAIIISVKSMIVIAYRELSRRIPRFRRFESLKANTILNYIEFVFWTAGAVVTGMSLKRGCPNTSCTFGALVMVLVIVLLILSLPVAVVSHMQLRFQRKHGYHPDELHHSRDKDIVYNLES